MKTDDRTLIDHTAHEEVLGYDPEEYPLAGTSWTSIAIGVVIVMAASLYGLGVLLWALFALYGLGALFDAGR